MKLGLGTVRFGQAYGLAGGGTRVAADEVEAILRSAAERGVRYLDTAPGYGDSETTLGAVLGADHPFRIVTKTPVFRRPLEPDDARAVARAFHGSLARLRQPRAYGLLVHDADDLLGAGGERLWTALIGLRAAGEVERIGVSVYDGEQLDRVLERHRPDLVQLPLSLLDQRLLDSGHVARLRERGVEVHARSVLLQGLLLLDPRTLPPFFAPVRPRLVEIRARLGRGGLSPLAAALAFVRDVAAPDAVICGVDSRAQLDEILDALAAPASGVDWSACRLDDPRVLDPRRWEVGAPGPIIDRGGRSPG